MSSLRSVVENVVLAEEGLHVRQCELLLHDGRLHVHLLSNDIHVNGAPLEAEGRVICKLTGNGIEKKREK